MSFTERLILWLHIGVAIFTIGPVTAAIMSTPRYIRKRDTVVVAFLHRITRLYAIGSLLVLVFGLVLAQQRDDFAKPWVSISMTLFVVALVLLVLIDRDQSRAVEALRREGAAAVPATKAMAVTEAKDADASAEDAADAPAKTTVSAPAPAAPADADRIAAVERGRIASLGGVTSLIWLVILILMVWK